MTSSLSTGTATPGGATVNAVFANGSYVSKTYMILTASGGVSGTFASTVANTNLSMNFHSTLSYDANDAYLNLVIGTAQAADSALTIRRTEMEHGWSAAATFEGEFSGVRRSYAGKGLVRYAW